MVGVDEVGRGAWAGPLLVVAARAVASLPPDLRDSKLLTKKQREEILDLLSDFCEFGEGWVSPAEIDAVGLGKALTIGGQRALANLDVGPGEDIVLDGKYNYLPKSYKNVRAIVDADSSQAIVSAASIYAKVKRDQLMVVLSGKHPSYGFERHVGYGTNLHNKALSKLGVLKNVHRLSFKPVGRAMSQ